MVVFDERYSFNSRIVGQTEKSNIGGIDEFFTLGNILALILVNQQDF